MSTSHTVSTSPGPWRSGIAKSGTAFLVHDSRGRLICEMSWHATDDTFFPLKDESKANSELISAAPELLNALEMLADTYGFDPSIDSAIWQTAFSALAKAGRHRTDGPETSEKQA